MLAAVPDEDSGHLDQPQAVAGLLLVARQQRPSTATPARAPPPTASPGGASRRPRRASPVRCALCGGHSFALPRAPWSADCRSPCPGTGAGAPPCRLRPFDHDGVQRGGQELVVTHVRPGHDHAERPAVGLHQQGAFTPFLAPSVGLGPTRSPQNGPCPSPRRPLATPSHPAQLLAFLHQGPQTWAKTPSSTHPLEGAVHGRVVGGSHSSL
jgi:hypothetical protein